MKIGKAKIILLISNCRLEMIYIKKEIINGVEYREVTLRGRTKLIAKDGSAINPKRRNQKATIHYNTDGYPCYGGGIPVHLYVAHGWVDGYFEGAEVNHKDFNRNNYAAENLEWVTHHENINYTLTNNYDVVCKSKQGVLNGRATFTEDEIRLIRKMYQEGNSIADIIKHFHPELKTVNDYRNIHSTYSNVVKYKTWKNII